jgi:PAS domain S-box-containing protein
MSYHQANTPTEDPPKSDPLARFLNHLGEAETALQQYLAARPDSADSLSTHAHPPLPTADYLKSLRERAEKARFDTPIQLEGLSQEEIKHLFHELQVHQVELSMQNEELIRVQLELENSRDRFSSLYDFAPAGYCTIDRKGIILEANFTLCSLLGVTAGELLQTSIQRYIPEADQDRFYLYHRAALRSRSSQICELQLVKSGGERFVAQFECRAAPDQSDHLWLVVSDISNLKRAEEIAARYEAVAAAGAALEIERNRYCDLFEFAPDGYFVTDETGTILDVNQAGTALLLAPKDQLVGASLSHYVVSKDQTAFQSQMKSILQQPAAATSARPGEWEVQVRANGVSEGHPHTVSVSAVLLREKPDNLVRIRWSIRDITLRKQTEAELKKSESRFHALFAESSIGIRMLDLQGRTLASNAAVQEILGYCEEELRPVLFTQLTDPLDQAQDETLFKTLLSGETDRYTLEKRCIRKDGERVWVHQVVFLVRDEVNNPSFIVVMTENISERKQRESELAEVRRRMMDSPEAERLLLSQELHDGPMQVLYGVLYKLKSLNLEGTPSAEDEQIIAECYRTIVQVISVLRGLAGELRPPTLMNFGLEKAIRSHAEQFRQDHPEINIHVHLMPDGKILPERVRLALYRIYQQAMANIVRHAEASQIQIDFRLEEKHVHLEMIDNGRGFNVPQKLVDLVREGHLGLVGSSERADAVGGKMTIDSKPGKGTSILVEINL